MLQFITHIMSSSRPYRRAVWIPVWVFLIAAVPAAQAQSDPAVRIVVRGDSAFVYHTELLPPGYMKIPAVLVRLLLPMAALVSIYFLLRGHNAPGGGFVGGLVMATALITQYMVGGTLWVEAHIRIHPQVLVSFGLLAAAIAGMSAWFVSMQFLDAQAVDLHLPLIGDLHLSSVLLFDLGVYLSVVGATVLMLIALAHQSLRSARKVPEPAEQNLSAAVASEAVS